MGALPPETPAEKVAATPRAAGSRRAEVREVCGPLAAVLGAIALLIAMAILGADALVADNRREFADEPGVVWWFVYAGLVITTFGAGLVVNLPVGVGGAAVMASFAVRAESTARELERSDLNEWLAIGGLVAIAIGIVLKGMWWVRLRGATEAGAISREDGDS
jgi:hypothetical protein